MPQSEQFDKIATALCRFQKQVKSAVKGSTAKIPTKSGGGYEYSYADLEAVWQTARCDDLMHECELSITQTMGFVIVGEAIHDTLETQLNHNSGQWKRGEQRLPLKSDDAQGQGSAQTYARRYGMCAILGIVPKGDDDDGARATEQAREQRSSTPKSDTPPCPECGKPLLKSKRNAGQLYCWTTTGGCGYDSLTGGSDDEEGKPPIATTHKEGKDDRPKPEPASTDAENSSKTVGKPAGTIEKAQWDELKRVGLENQWPEQLMKMQIDQRKRKGMSQVEIFNDMFAKVSKPNNKAVTDDTEALKDLAQEAGF